MAAMMGPEDYRRSLVRGLVGEKHAHLYASSPSFHAAVDVLARTLPAWVDGLAALAEEEDASLDRARLLMGQGKTVTVADVATPLSDVLDGGDR